MTAVQAATGLDPAANLAQTLAWVDRAAAEGARLVVFPEGTMCAFGDPGTDLVPLAEPLDGTFVTALCAAARRHSVTVVAGMFEPSPEPGLVYNTVVAVGPFGLLGAYRKYHLFDALGWTESDRFAAGDPTVDEPVVFEVDEGLVVGVVNCYDLRFPEMGRVLVDRGATVLAVTANWIAGPGKGDVFATLARARAIENTAYVVAAAKPAPECAGRSMVVDPLGDVLDETGEGDGVTVSADLSADRVDEVRARLPLLEHRRFSVR